MKLFTSILVFAVLLFAADGTFYRNSTVSQNGVIIATYISKTNDTVMTANIPGSSVPYSITVTNDTILSHPDIIIVPDIKDTVKE